VSCTIELLGIDSHNKGALLMLEACCERLRAWQPDVRIAISYRFDPILRLRYGLWATLPREKLHFGLAAAWERLPKGVCRIGTLVQRSEINVILDASGFAYGDAWPTKKLKHRLAETILRRKEGKPLVILLPQAFGPFSDPSARKLIRAAVPSADLAFARDDASLSFLEEAIGAESPSLRRAPDFTNLLQAPAVEDEAHICASWIVPNTKVEERALSEDSSYINFLIQSVNSLRSRGLEPKILIHEGPRDEAVARELNRRLDTPLHVYRPDCAIKAKSVLAHARCVISSRYHALVSSLAAGVPSLACGWSHKYDALMADYGLTDMVIDLAKPETWGIKISRLLDLTTSPDLKSELMRASAVEKQKTSEMWNLVFTCIEKADKWRSIPASP
jgi:polysaccharide pyruvyl transferase WcaK-like protein